MIQITNPGVYTSTGLITPAIYVTPEFVEMNDTNQYGSIVFYTRAYPRPTVTLVIDNNPNNCNMFIEDHETLGNDWDDWVVTYESDDPTYWRQFRAHLHIVSGDNYVDVPIYGVRPEVYQYTVVATPDNANINLSAEFID